MKLKKIASLALAGVMAVSMLAGCGNNGSANSTPNTDGETSTGADVAAVLDDVVASSIVDFSNDSKLTSVLQQVLDVYGTQAYDANGTYDVAAAFSTAVFDLGGLKQVKAKDVLADTNNRLTWGDFFLNERGQYDNTWEKKEGDLDGKTFTNYAVMAYKYDTQEAAMNAFATQMDTLIKKTYPLATLSQGATTAQGNDKYYEYSYTCPVGMASVKDVDGGTIYFFILGMSQHVTAKSV